MCGLHIKTVHQSYRKYQKKGNQLWLSWIKPHEPVGRQTISRWLKQTLKLGGIDTSKFLATALGWLPHPKPMPWASSKAMGVGLSTILNTAGWASKHNFIKFYCRDKNKDDQYFAAAVLDITKQKFNQHFSLSTLFCLNLFYNNSPWCLYLSFFVTLIYSQALHVVQKDIQINRYTFSTYSLLNF